VSSFWAGTLAVHLYLWYSKGINMLICPNNKIEKELQLQYKNFVKKEKKKLTSEGNQMALDLEVLEPLRILAEGTITEKKCSEADFANDLNNSDNEKSYNQIKEQISLICNN